MKVVLDTQAFLWFLVGDARLSHEAREAIENDANERLLSIASTWEMAIKASLGKLTLAQPLAAMLREQLRANGVALLPLTLDHVEIVAGMPFHHRDPFDRIIVAQSLHERAPLVTADAILERYGIERIW